MISALLTLLKFAKFGPILKAALMMLLAVGGYALFFGWKFALGFVALVYVHELGHYVAMRRLGLRAGWPVVLPFIGWTRMLDQPHTAAQEASIAFGGPFLGTMAAAAVLAAALAWHNPLLMALAYSGFFLNLINLIPILPFDGGRIVAVLSPKVWFVGLPLFIALFAWSRNPMTFLILLLLVPTVWASLRAAWRGEVPAHNPRYYEVPGELRIRYASYYLLLAAFLCIMAFETLQQVQPGGAT